MTSEPNAKQLEIEIEKIYKDLTNNSDPMTEYEMACTTIPQRMNEELKTRNKEGWEPINMVIGKELTSNIQNKILNELITMFYYS